MSPIFRSHIEALRPERSPAIRHRSLLFAKSWIYMRISDQSFPYVLCTDISTSMSFSAQVSPDPNRPPAVDLIVVRENTECLVCSDMWSIIPF
jgi:hypothetical protein